MAISLLKSGLISIKYKHKGFTLLELLIVIAIMGILSVVGVSSLLDYVHNQTLNQAANDVASKIYQARSNAQAQVKPDDIDCDILKRWRIEFTSESTYKFQLRCADDQDQPESDWAFMDAGSDDIPVPKDVIISNPGIALAFEVITGGVFWSDLDVADQKIVLTAYSKQKVITLDSIGNVTIAND